MKIIPLVLCGASLVACASSPSVRSASGDIAPVVPANSRMLPRGSQLRATFNETIGTSMSHVGDRFTATVSQALIAQNGSTVVPEGAKVYGHITGLAAGRGSGDQSAIRLDFDKLAFGGRDYSYDAEVSDVDAKNSVNNSRVGKGALIGGASGAVLGAVISGGSLSALVAGGVIGAAAGTVISLGTGETDARIPDGTTMTLTSAKSITLR